MPEFNVNRVEPINASYPLPPLLRDADGDYDLPYVLQETTYSPQTIFDTSISRHRDGSIDSGDTIEKLRKLIIYSTIGDSMGYNSLIDLFCMIINIAGVWKELNTLDQDTIQDILSREVSKDNPLLSVIATHSLPAMVHGYFFKKNPTVSIYNETTEFAKHWCSIIPSSYDCPITLPFVDQMGNILYDLQDWMEKNSYIDPQTGDMILMKSFENFVVETSIQWQNDCALNGKIDQTGGMLNQIQQCMVKKLEKKYSDPDNPGPLCLGLVSFLADENNDMQINLTSRGLLLRAMSKTLGDPAQTVFSMWATGNFDENSIQKFYNEVKTIGKVCGFEKDLPGDKRLEGLKEQIAPFYKNFFALKGEDGSIEVDDPAATGSKITLGQLYQDCIAQPPKHSWGHLVQAFKSLYPTPGDPNAPNKPIDPLTPPNYTTISSNIASIQTAITNSSAAQGQIMQEIEGMSQKLLALIAALWSSLLDHMKTAVRNLSAPG